MGTSWISRKGGIIEKREVDLEKGGGMTPLSNYVNINLYGPKNT